MVILKRKKGRPKKDQKKKSIPGKEFKLSDEFRKKYNLPTSVQERASAKDLIQEFKKLSEIDGVKCSDQILSLVHANIEEVPMEEDKNSNFFPD